MATTITPKTLRTAFAPALRHSFTTSSPFAVAARRKKAKSSNYQDVYAAKQSELRKQANLRRRAFLRDQEAKELGDPIRGKPTSFVESLDFALPQDPGNKVSASSISIETVATQPNEKPSDEAKAILQKNLDHGLDEAQLTEALERSRLYTEPLSTADRPAGAPDTVAEERGVWQEQDAAATEAVQRITSLANASSKHRTRKNVERIVEKFGRHVTDAHLRPRPTGVNHSQASQVPTPRAGPDTGSSEVQIAILTAKIRVLADRFQGKSRRDKANKRNLRLLLHRRQKLLKYMERKERGSERWQHMIETLGLTPATWHGEIEVH